MSTNGNQPKGQEEYPGEENYVQQLVIGKGLSLSGHKDVDEDLTCKWTLTSSGINVGSTGCGKDEECFGLGTGCLIFSGLGFEKKDSDVYISGPKIKSEEITATTFNELVIGTGLKLTKTDEDDEDSCSYTIGTTAKVGATGCGNDEECFDLTGCLVFSSGLELEKDNNGGGTVTGPKLTYGGEGGGSPIAATNFKELVFSTGTKVESSDDGCTFTITASGGSGAGKVGGTGCGNDVACFDHTGCLVFGRRIKVGGR